MPGETATIKRESPIALLLLKLEAWMVQQPEWLEIVNMPRQQRRAAMRELANRLYTIPQMDGVNTVPRQLRRKVTKEMVSAAKEEERQRQALLKQMLADALLREARASVALDGETQSVMPDGSFIGGVSTPAGEPFIIEDTPPDPEGDIKADIEAGKAASDDDYPDIPLDR